MKASQTYPTVMGTCYGVTTEGGEAAYLIEVETGVIEPVSFELMEAAEDATEETA